MIDGEVTSYFEWIGAGMYRVDDRSGAMHGKKYVVKEAQYGRDGTNFYLRLDFDPAAKQELPGMELRLSAQLRERQRSQRAGPHFRRQLRASLGRAAGGGRRTGRMRLLSILECDVPLASLGVTRAPDALPVFSVAGRPADGGGPQQGWLEMRTTDPAEMGGCTRSPA